MTGPEHYTAAERIIREATDILAEGAPAADLIAVAQVHATLANAAATAMCGYAEDGLPAADFHAWDKVAGVVGADRALA